MSRPSPTQMVPTAALSFPTSCFLVWGVCKAPPPGKKGALPGAPRCKPIGNLTYKLRFALAALSNRCMQLPASIAASPCPPPPPHAYTPGGGPTSTPLALRAWVARGPAAWVAFGCVQAQALRADNGLWQATQDFSSAKMSEKGMRNHAPMRPHYHYHAVLHRLSALSSCGLRVPCPLTPSIPSTHPR